MSTMSEMISLKTGVKVGTSLNMAEELQQGSLIMIDGIQLLLKVYIKYTVLIKIRDTK